jgi:hypothetical protein
MILSVSTLIGVILASASTGVVVGIVGKKVFDQPDPDCTLGCNNFTIDVSPCHFCDRDLEDPSSGATFDGSQCAFSGSRWNDFLKLHTQ